MEDKLINQMDYKKYSLEQLCNWMHDALSSSEASPQEIYDVIKGVVEEQYLYQKDQANRCQQLLALLNGNERSDINVDYSDRWSDFWKQNYYPEEYKGSTVSSVQYTEEELNAMCDKAASDDEKEKCHEHNLRKEDKVVKWQLPVEVDTSGEYFVIFPDDLLGAANLKEGDQVRWVDNGDGSYTLTKVTKPLGMDEC